MPIVLMNFDDGGTEVPLPDDPAAVAVIVAGLLPKLRFSDLNRLRLDIIPRVLRQKAKELAAAQGLDAVTAMRAAGIEPDDEDGAAGAGVPAFPNGTDPTSGLPTVVPVPMPRHDDDDDEPLEPTPLEAVELFDRPDLPTNEGSAEKRVTIQ